MKFLIALPAGHAETTISHHRGLTQKQIRDRLSADDPSALAMIWDWHAEELLGYLVSIFCCQKEGEDALQDLFVSIAGNKLK